MKTKKYSKGFTLVELLVVIAIIGILAAVVLVSLSSQRQKAQQSSALQSIKSAMPYAAECLVKGGTLSPPAVGVIVCSTAGATSPKWPATLPGTCAFDATSNATTQVVLSGCGTGATITCLYETGACTGG